MRVNCPYCPALYEIEESELGTTGQQYQCVSCNNLFLVEAPTVSPTPPAQAEELAVDLTSGGLPDSFINGIPSQPNTIDIDDIPSPTQDLIGTPEGFTPPDSKHIGGSRNNPTTFPMKDPQPPEVDFTPPMTSHAPTELPTGFIPDPTQGGSAAGTGFSPPTGHLEFPSQSIPPAPTSTPAEFNPYNTGAYGAPTPQKIKSSMYAQNFKSDDNQSIHLVEDGKAEDDKNKTDLWNVRIGSKIERGLQLIQIKNWIRNAKLRETDEVQEPGGEWIQAIESIELERFFNLKAKINADRIASQLDNKKDAEIYCLNHVEDQAHWQCVGCDRPWCEDCVQKRVFGGAKVNMCPKCGDRCVPIERREDVPAFWHQLPDIFTFPIRKHGPIMLGLGVLLSTLAQLILVMTFGLGIFVYFALIGLVFSYHLVIIRKSAIPGGSMYMPEFPDVSEKFWQEMFLPFFQIVIAFILYFIVPIAVAVYFMSKYQSFFVKIVDGKPVFAAGTASVLFIGFSILGYYLFPMVIAVLARHKTVVPAFNPILIIKLIKRVIGPYTLMIIFLTVILIASVILGDVLKFVLTKLGFPWLILWAANGIFYFYSYAVMARLMGLFLRKSEEDLAWKTH